MDYEIIQINENTWRIEDSGVRFFLLAAKKQALLIDSGMMVHNAKEIAQSLTDLPVSLLNTHADRDHIGSNEEFEKFYMHPDEEAVYRRSQKPGVIIPVKEGDVIDLGERELLAIALPGHTPGSTALLDKNNGMLFSGDPIQDGHIFMFGEMRDLSAYIHSLRRLDKYKDDIKGIYANHGTLPVDYSIVPKLIEGALQVERGEIVPTEADRFGKTVHVYDVGGASFLCD
jgi:glyoxylase-like metal-dependent hydrolase (beta-lactamase superfamily II)